MKMNKLYINIPSRKINHWGSECESAAVGTKTNSSLSLSSKNAAFIQTLAAVTQCFSLK